MTKEFDPTRPCRYGDGETPLAVFVLPEPLASGETIISVSRSGSLSLHFPDGHLYKDCCSTVLSLDLINIPEEVEVTMWGVVPSGGKRARVVLATESAAEHHCRPSEVVVPLTGSYTR